jgi:hypothetical protein
VLACGNAIYRLDHDASGRHATLLVTLPFAPDSIQVGDVTGDAVADLLAVASGTLYVIPQLTSREVAR